MVEAPKKEWKKARPGTKRRDAADVMHANADKPMEEVIKLIAAAVPCSMREARSHYVWLVTNGYAPGVVVKTSRAKREPIKISIEERAVKIATNPDHCFWIGGNSAKETLAGYGMQRVARFKLTDEKTISLFWEVEDAKKWTEVVYAQVIGDRIVRIGSSMGQFGKRFGTDVDKWLTDALHGKKPKAPPWEAPAWRDALRHHDGIAEIYAHEAPKFDTKTGTHSICLNEENALLKRHCPPFNRGKYR